MPLRPSSLALLGLLFSSAVLAEDASKQTADRQAACVAAVNEKTAALVARDWHSLERVSTAYLKACRGVLDLKGLSDAHETIAIANNELGKPKRALAAADACIAMSYVKTGCHLQRLVSLLALRRLSEARATLERADRLLAHRLDAARRDLQAVRDPAHKELLSARINNFEAQQSYADSLRALHLSE